MCPCKQGSCRGNCSCGCHTPPVSGYDASEWKRGDVAMVTARWWWNKPHTTKRAIRDVGCWTTGSRDVMDHEVSDIRLLVVVDPEDSRFFAVEAAQRACSALNVMPGRVITPAIEAVQDVLREFARPTPRIEEPTGLGAVVEDESGQIWISVDVDGGRWHHKIGHTQAEVREWRDFTAVRILSPGVEVDS